MNFNYPCFMFPPPMTLQPQLLLFQQLQRSQNLHLETQNQGFPKLKAESVKEEEEEPQVNPTLQKQEEPLASDYQEARKPWVVNPLAKEGHKKKKEVDSFTEKRNIIPNNINHVLSHIQRKNKSQQLVLKAIAKLGGEKIYTAKRFYCYQTFLKQQLHIHVNRETLRELTNHLDLNESIFSVEEQLFFNRVSRILIFHYLRGLAKLKILSSHRVKLTSKLDHLRAQRNLLEYMTNRPDQ